MFVCLSRSYIAGTVHIINILYSYVKKDIFSLRKERILSQGFSQRSTVASKVRFLDPRITWQILVQDSHVLKNLGMQFPLWTWEFSCFFPFSAEPKARVAGDRGGNFFPEKLLVKVPPRSCWLKRQTQSRDDFYEGRHSIVRWELIKVMNIEYWLWTCAEIVNSHWWFVIKDYEWFWILNFL